VLLVCQKNFKMIPIKLQTVRPFIFETVDLEDNHNVLARGKGELHEKVFQFCTKKVQEMIEKSKEKLSGNPKQPTIPLIRLRVLYSDEDQLCNPVRLGQQFAKEVANPGDIIKFIKQASKKTKGTQVVKDETALKSAFQAQRTRAEDVVDQYFADMEVDEQKLELFQSKTLSELCRRLVDNDDDDAADIILKQEMEMAITFLHDKNAVEDDIHDFMADFRDFKGDEIHNKILGMLDANTTRRVVPAANNVSLIDSGSDEDDDAGGSRNTTATASRGTARGRGARGAARGARGRGRGAKAAAAAMPAPDPPSPALNIRVNVRTHDYPYCIIW
jgi:double-strand break repair protein MRE11